MKNPKLAKTEFDFNEIARLAQSDPGTLVAQGDARYNRQLEAAARGIADSGSRIVLLSGPSGSGKTTTAHKLQQALLAAGISSYVISMDDYFLTVNPETHPRNDRGEIDYESPYCVDIDLFTRHTAELSRGAEVLVPRFNFARQSREAEDGTPLRLKQDEIAIFEGIHALNPMFFGSVPAHKLYVSARADIRRDTPLFFKGTWVRLCRRIIRDAKFRGTEPSFSLALWGNIRRGEKAYISPHKDNADCQIDTAMPHELCVLRAYAVPMLAQTPPVCDRREELLTISPRLVQFPPIPEDLIAPDSLLREFIGGGILPGHFA